MSSRGVRRAQARPRVLLEGSVTTTWPEEGMALADVAAAGGWKSKETSLRSYQQPNEAAMLVVVMGAGSFLHTS